MSQSQDQEVLDKVLTVPNVITLCRFLLIPIFIYLRFFTSHKLAALVVFAVAACTDWVDGQVARHTGQVSRLGKVFDPVVDRFLLATGVISVCVEGSLPLPVFLHRHSRKSGAFSLFHGSGVLLGTGVSPDGS